MITTVLRLKSNLIPITFKKNLATCNFVGMMRRIYLVRHAQAEPGSAKVSDESRALIPQGEAVSKQVGKFLNQKNSNLNLIITSHAIRAHQTSLNISTELNQPTEIQIERILYSENKLAILGLLTALPEACIEVMLVGHYPTVVEIHNYLASNKQLTSMNTGELVALSFTTDWAALSQGTASHDLSYHPSYHQA
jgi:phosphohistidine phosphatase